MGANDSVDVKIADINGDIKVVLEKIGHIADSQDEIKCCYEKHENRIKSLEASRATAKGISWGIGSVSSLSFIKIMVDLVKGLWK